MVGRAQTLLGITTKVTDKSLCRDLMVVEELLHGIVVIHGYDIVFRIMAEHDIEVAAGCPATGERIIAESRLETL